MNMLNSTVALFALVFALVATSAETATFHGQVLSTNGGELTLSTGGEIVRFTVAGDAAITLDGQPVRLDDLTADHVADVAAQRRDDEWIATKIVARSQKVVAFASVRVAGLTLSEHEQTDAEAIEGKWEVTSFTKAGKSVESLLGDVVVFADGRCIHLGKKGLDRARYWIDPTAHPKQFDLEVTDEDGRPALCKGIYRLIGKNLTVCHSAAGAADRPTEFASDENNGHTLVVLRRHESEVQQ